MRFHRLQIPAFGPFTNLDLAFPPRDHDLHVFYGKNEAGKSSLLRAIRDLLYGIPGQSADNFLHDYKNLRLAAEITNQTGARLSFQRRKGNKNTLLDESENPLPESALLPFLGNVERDFFSSMFGLGGRELRDGARQILEGHGDLGNALFSASLGGTPVQQVLAALEAESEQIFKGRAKTNVSIRPAVKRYQDLLKQSREATVAGDLWDTLCRNLDSKTEQKTELETEIAEGEIAISWITRCEDALPSVSRFNEELRLLGELPEMPDLASDFVARTMTARDEAREASRRVNERSSQITRDEARLEKCVTSPAVLAIEVELDGLHQDLGAYRTRKESLANLESKLAGIEPTLRSGMVSLEIEGEFEVLEKFRLGSAARLDLEAAAKAWIDAENRQAANFLKIEEMTAAINTHTSELQSLPEADLEPLRMALAVAAEASEAEKTLEATHASVKTLSRKVQEEHALVKGAPSDFKETSRLEIPTKATLRKFREQFDQMERDLEAATKAIRDEDSTIVKLQQDLTRLERRGELPTEGSLKQARDLRDHGWNLVVKSWLGDGTDEQLDPEQPLEKAFPQSIQAADQIADQLRFEADAVAQAEEKRMQIQASQNRITETRKAISQLQSAKDQCQESWHQEWAASGIKPRTPDEMEEWREHWMQFRDSLSAFHEAKEALHSKSKRIREAVEALMTAMGIAEGKPYSALVVAAKDSLQKSEKAMSRRELIAEQLGDLRDKLKGLKQEASMISAEIKTAKADWQTRSENVGLAPNTFAETGLLLLQERVKLLEKFDQWKECAGEATQLATWIAGYESQVRKRADLLGVSAETTEAQESTLWKMLSAAREAQTAHDQIISQLEDAKNHLIEAEQDQAKASTHLLELMSLAKITEVEELEPFLAALEKRDLIETRLASIRDTLGGLARGQKVEEFVRLVEAENPDDLAQRKARIQLSLEEKKSALQAVQNELNELRRQRDDLAKAGDAAADLRQQAESELATLRRDASQFLRLRLAAHFLRTQIEKFREQNQAPLLEKSGRVFRHLTEGAFVGLAPEFNDQDVPVLVGTKSGGVNVPIEGMSDGTRDQLYLALRLAALDRHLEEHEPMPLILDDLLITFDNDRTRAILPELADLSKRTQVFLFTHHEHLIDLCRETLGEGKFQLHSL